MIDRCARRYFVVLIAVLSILAACGDDPDDPSQGDAGLADGGDAGASADADGGHTSPDAGDVGEDFARDTALDDFVADDSDFEYEVAWEEEGALADVALLDVTSQTWRSDDEVDRTTWEHDVVVAVPEDADTSTSLLLVNGGSNDGEEPDQDDEDVSTAQLVASEVGTPVVVASQIPNQPLTIEGEGEDMVEDDLVASSWHMAIETGDPTWSAYFPMARSVSRAMDAVQDYMDDNDAPVDDFVLTGFSKRGATTYLATAADRRVRAMAPGVFDFLNFRPQAEHHLDVYGEPAPAVADYAEYDLLERVDDEESDILLETSDPYAYRERFTMPKLIMASTGDQFFLPDSMRFYIDDIPGETLVRYVPNSGHSLTPPGEDMLDLIEPLAAWYTSVVDEEPRPELTWTHDAGELTVSASPEPDQVNLWTGTNEEERNFRFDVVEDIFESTELEADEEGDYTATVDPPDEGYTAYLIEAIFDDQVYTTQTYVTPDD
ncbi:MAG: PhoPQ-activated protein PqaA family protein [Persicimonas sp.]